MKARQLPTVRTLAELPPDARGVSWHEWFIGCRIDAIMSAAKRTNFEREQAEANAQAKPQPRPTFSGKRITYKELTA